MAETFPFDPATSTERWRLPDSPDVRIGTHWIAPPDVAFIPSDDPRYLQLGWGYRSNGAWAPIGVRHDALRFGAWVTGPMGRGKTVLLRQLFRQLLTGGMGFAALDGKGLGLVYDTLSLIPLEREGQVAIFDPDGMELNGEHLIPALNVLAPEAGQGLPVEVRASVLATVLATLDPWLRESQELYHAVSMLLLAVMAGEPRATAQHILRFLDDTTYRASVSASIADDQVRDFWLIRFPKMTGADLDPFILFRRQLLDLLNEPALAALLVAPTSSLNLCELMDTGGILLAGVSSGGVAAQIAARLLVAQGMIAGLSRANISDEEDAEGFCTTRPDFHWCIDEAPVLLNGHILFGRMLLRQLRAMRVGVVLANQSTAQLDRELLDELRTMQHERNPLIRVILGAGREDAIQHAEAYAAQGLTERDFRAMEQHQHQRLTVPGSPILFSALMMGCPTAPPQPDLPPIRAGWAHIAASARTRLDRSLDVAIQRLKVLADRHPNEAIRRLGQLYLADPVAYTLYCDRTRAHRLAQRAFILRNPGAIPDQALRIRTLSALWIGVPTLETQALHWAIQEQARTSRPAVVPIDLSQLDEAALLNLLEQILADGPTAEDAGDLPSTPDR
ncbi:MAG TPA: hypothetical protein VFS21_19850 [Roseiflexaceae bacterium]|nr:hypothetical protein [Roseiflexaceae bacterium]